MTRPVELFKQRPAESAMPLATVGAILIGRAIGIEDTDTIAYIAIVLSFVPAVVTWVTDMVRGKESDGTVYQPPSAGSS